MDYLLAPSLLSADFGNLQRDIEMVNESEADWFHVDVMDGVFVPNISFGFPVLEYIKKHALKPLDVHLMIVNPDNFVKEFRDAGASVITVHYETCPHLHRTIQNIKSTGADAGVALNPHTPIHLLEDIIHELDLVLIMSVNPGFGGQSFIEHSLERIKKLSTLIKNKNANTRIEVDGGVGLNNAQQLIDSGANVLVAGNAVFKSKNPTQTIAQLKSFK